MDYRVIVSKRALESINLFVAYLLLEKNSLQAAQSVADDYEETLRRLSVVAGGLKFCDDPELASLGYRRINFKRHKYFLVYHVEEDVAYVDRVFHFDQDYENAMK